MVNALCPRGSGVQKYTLAYEECQLLENHSGLVLVSVSNVVYMFA